MQCEIVCHLIIGIVDDDSPVLEPDLNYTHVQTRVLGQLLTYMSGGFRTIVVCGFQSLQLLGGDCGARTFIRLIPIQGAIQVEAFKKRDSIQIIPIIVERAITHPSPWPLRSPACRLVCDPPSDRIRRRC